jgi:ADP-ribose pyrophosphatase YjhB (NUDIX family)
VEYDDDFLTTAIQEAREETGLDVEVVSILNVVSSFLSPGFHFLAVYVLAQIVGGQLQAGDDLESVAWFPLAGPLPEMAFEEDENLLARCLAEGIEGLPVDPGYAVHGSA